MTISFDFQNVTLTEFGFGRDDDEKGTEFVLVPADAGVQLALQEMAIATRDGMNKIKESDVPLYDPSEKYSGTEYLYLPVENELASQMRHVHEAKNMKLDSNALSNPDDVFCYFARMKNSSDQYVTGVRRASQFKGILKNRLLRFLTDTLMLIEDKVFKLDNDFDLLIDGINTHILRPSGFEFLGQLQEAVKAAAPENAKLVQADLTFVDFSSIESYATKHTRAARYLASIRMQKQAKGIEKSALKKLCKQTGVKIQEVNGKLVVESGSELGFLEVLDRRRYHLALKKNSSEYFKAGSRRKIGDITS